MTTEKPVWAAKTRAEGLERLQLLHDNMRAGKAAHPRFFFGDFNQPKYLDDVEEPKPEFAQRGCQSLGCLVGELPTFWPEFFTWSIHGIRPYESSLNETERPLVTAQKFFGLTIAESRHLFLPHSQQPSLAIIRLRKPYKLTASASLDGALNNLKYFLDKTHLIEEALQVHGESYPFK